eukprot:5354732-Pyramimonas_sp.AAC.1
MRETGLARRPCSARPARGRGRRRPCSGAQPTHHPLRGWPRRRGSQWTGRAAPPTTTPRHPPPGAQ